MNEHADPVMKTKKLENLTNVKNDNFVQVTYSIKV